MTDTPDVLIPATTPVVAPPAPSITYDRWFCSQIISKFTAGKNMFTCHLRRATKIDGIWVLAPVSKDSDVSFTVDPFDPAFVTAHPEIRAALIPLFEAFHTYAAAEKLV